MRFSTSSRPSPGAVLGVIAITFALVGTAVAGSDGLTAKVTKAQVRSIAKKQVRKAAPKLTVANAASADSLPVQGLVSTDPLRVSRARNLTSAQVTSPSTGVFCFDLDFQPAGVQATPEAGNGDEFIVSAIVDPFSRLPKRGGNINSCTPGIDVQVTVRDQSSGTRANNAFYFLAYR